MRLIIVLILSFALSACEWVQDEENEFVFRTAVEVATLRLIEQSSDVSRETVRQFVSDVRDRVDLDGEITSNEVMAAAEAVIDFDSLQSSERVLLRSILLYTEQRLNTYDNLDEVSATVDQILTWVEEIVQ